MRLKSIAKKIRFYFATLGIFSIFVLKTASIVLQLLIIFPLIGLDRKKHFIHCWVGDYLQILGISTHISNKEILPPFPYLIVANHISWVDFLALNSLRPIRLVAKKEIARLPIIGMMAKRIGIIFTNRTNIFEIKGTIKKMSMVLQEESICFFPEGTTHLGEVLMPFKCALFESAVLTNTPVFPLVIRYVDSKTGVRTNAPAYVANTSFLATVFHILLHRPLQVMLEVLDPAPLGLDRRGLAEYCRLKIESRIECN